jgi:uncharacterized membrane protein
MEATGHVVLGLAPVDRFSAVLATYGSNGYDVIELLHILSVIAAFGPLFIYPSLVRAGAGTEVAKWHLRLSLPALVLAWVFGMAMVGMSDDVIEMSDGWIIASLLIWVVLVLIGWFLIRPSLSDNSDRARSMLSAGIGITHVGLVVMLWLMVFKPGM